MPTNYKSRAQWTIMIYMADDDQSSLDAAIEFLAELEALGQDWVKRVINQK